MSRVTKAEQNTGWVEDIQRIQKTLKGADNSTRITLSLLTLSSHTHLNFQGHTPSTPAKLQTQVHTCSIRCTSSFSLNNSAFV